MKFLDSRLYDPKDLSQPARAVWIEIFIRSSQELKLVSQPARAVWIEIVSGDMAGSCGRMSQPARAVWIEIVSIKSMNTTAESQPARAVWIEIQSRCRPPWKYQVTACEGCVD